MRFYCAEGKAERKTRIKQVEPVSEGFAMPWYFSKPAAAPF